MNGKSPKLKNAAALYPIEPANPAAANFVVIPVFDENSYICATLESVKKALDNSPQPVAVILVLNEPASARA